GPPAAGLPPALERAVGERGVGEPGDPGDGDLPGLRQGATGPGAGALRRPPAAAEGRRGDEPHDAVLAVDEPDEGGPDRDTAHVVLRPVDRVDDPPALAGPDVAELLAD